MVMLSQEKPRYDVFWSFWIKVIKENEMGTVLIAEGKRDERALRKLLIVGDILLLQNSSISAIIEKMKIRKSDRAIIFTDFDRKGEILAKKLRIAMIREGITVLDEYRKKFKGIVKVSHIEDLNGLADDLLDNAPFYIYVKNKLLKEINLG